MTLRLCTLPGLSESELTEFENFQNNDNNELFSAPHLVFILEILKILSNSQYETNI
jgi:hypothetical protein